MAAAAAAAPAASVLKGNQEMKSEPKGQESASQSDLKRWVLNAFGGKNAPAASAAAVAEAPVDAPEEASSVAKEAKAATPARKRRRGAKKADGDAEPAKTAKEPAGAAKTPKRSPRSGRARTTPEKEAAPGKGMWWRCNRCSFSIPASLRSSARCSRKARHIKSHGVSTTANLNNYLSRTRMLRAVWNGKMERTPGGLTKADLMLNDRGRVVPVKRSSHSSKLFIGQGLAKKWGKWCRAHKAVRMENGIRQFLKVTKDGSSTQRELYQKVLERYNAPDTEDDFRPVRVKVERYQDTKKQTSISDMFGTK